jgi:hypothetical protein
VTTPRQRLDDYWIEIVRTVPRLGRERQLVLDTASDLAKYKPIHDLPRKETERQNELENRLMLMWTDAEVLRNRLQNYKNLFPGDLYRRLDPDGAISRLEDFIDAYTEAWRTVRRTPARPSGGAKERVLDRLRRDRAARMAHDNILVDYGGVATPLKKGDGLVILSRALFYVAFDRDPGGMLEACRDLMEPGRRERRRQRVAAARMARS